MKKRFLSIALTLAMVSSMAVGCGSSKSDSADSKKEEGAKTEASADTESNQILFNGSSTLAPVITSMATTFFDTYGTWDAFTALLVISLKLIRYTFFPSSLSAFIKCQEIASPSRSGSVAR